MAHQPTFPTNTDTISRLPLTSSTSTTARFSFEPSLQAFFEANPQAVWLVEQGVIVAANSVAHRLCGSDPSGTEITAWLPQEAVAIFEECAHNPSKCCEYTTTVRQGEFSWQPATVKLARLEVAAGPVTAAFFTPITERMYRELVENVDEIIYALDTEGRFTYISPAVTRLLDWQPEELLGQRYADLLPPAGREIALARIERVSAGETSLQIYQVRGKRGGSRWLQVRTKPITIQGQTVGMCGAARDVTELKRAEKELHASRRSYQAFMEQTSDFIWCVEYRPPIAVTLPPEEQICLMLARSYVTECNLATARRYQALHPSELINQPVARLMSLKEEDKVLLRRFIGNDYRLANAEITGRKGKTLLSNFDGLVENGHLARVWGVQRDITAFKKAQHSLAKSEQRLGLALMAGELALWDVNAATGEVYVNDQWFQQLGYQPEDTANIIAFWQTHAHPDDLPRLVEYYANLLEGTKASFQTAYRTRHKDGSWRWLASSGRTVEWAGDGAPLRIIGVNQDITEHRHLEEKFLQAQKMDAMGRMAGGVVHDFNNLLTVIKGYTDITLAELSKADPLYSRVEEINKAAERATGLTRQLLAFSRKQVLQSQIINLNAIIPRLETMLHRLIGEDIELRTSLAADLWDIEADPHQIEQALVNLVINARDAMPDGGWVTIGTANVAPEALPATLADKLQEYVMVAVSDTGHGIDKETQQRIFEPFFTTKGPGQGTGLGLATIYGLVQQSGGDIQCESELGLGTSFKLYFPRCARPAGQLAFTERAAAARTGRETILLVEDEELLRQMAAQLLRAWGYQVIEAANGQDALRAFEQSAEKIDLVLTDAVMPNMNGLELSQRLKKLQPTLPLIWMSGYNETNMARRGGNDKSITFLLKPFDIDELARCVRTMLDA